MAKEKLKLALEDVVEYMDDEDYKNSIAKVKFMSTRPNTHKINFSEEVLKRDASSVLGQWIIAEYSYLTQDATTHTDEQWIQGFIPSEQEVVFEYDEDGYLTATVDAVLSKLYAKNIYDLFKSNNQRAVSCEILANYSELLEDGSKDVLEFDICAISVLGKSYNPSIPNSEITITKFSQQEAEKEYANYLAKDKNIGSQILSTLQEISTKLEATTKENKEENMKKTEKFAIEIGNEIWNKVYNALRDKHPDEDGWGSIYCIKGIYEENTEKFVIVSGEESYYKIPLTYTETEFELSDELIEVEQKFLELEAVTKFAEEEVEKFEEKLKAEKEKCAEDDKGDEPTEPEDDEPEDKKDSEPEELAKKEKEDEAEKDKDNNKLSEIEKAELAELREFKTNTLAKETEEKVKTVLSQVETKLSKESFEKLSATGKECTFNTVENWTISVFAEVGKEALKLAEKPADKKEAIVFGTETPTPDEVVEGDVFERNKKYL